MGNNTASLSCRSTASRGPDAKMDDGDAAGALQCRTDSFTVPWYVVDATA